MPSNLSKRKTRLSVEFSDTVRERGKLREVVMEFHPYAVRVKLKGLRQAFEISPAGIFNLAVRLDVEKKRLAKKAGRKA